MSRGRSVTRIDAFGAGSLAVVTVAAYFAVARPLAEARSRRAAMQSELVDNQRRVAEIERSRIDLRGRLVETQQELAGGRLQLHASSLVNTRMALIVQIAFDSGLEIHEMRPNAGVPGEHYEMVPIALSGRGTYPDCAAFLHRLHESMPDTGVAAFELSGNPGSRGTAGSFRFDLVWYAAPAVGGAGESPP